MKWILLALVLLASPALAGDWGIKADASWVGRSDVNVQWTMTKATTQAAACTGALVAPATQMVGPFTATEIRNISVAQFAGSGQWICVHAFAYPGTDPTSALRSVEVSGNQSFSLNPPILSQQ